MSVLACLLFFGPIQKFLKFTAVSGDKLLFQLTAFDLHRHIVVVGADEAAAPFKTG